MSTQHRDLFTALAAPFAAGEVKARTQAGRQMQYVTARTVMNRLDEVVGPENWWDDYTPLTSSVICRLTLRLPDGQTLTKCDLGGCAGMADAGDDDKSGFSDAFKRAAVKFGIGRYLYRDGVATLTESSPATTVAADHIADANKMVTTPPPAPAAARAGSDDAQGRGGKLAYGQAGARRKSTDKPVTGEDLHYYALDCQLDAGLSNWIINSFNPQGYPDRLINWTPDDVRRALPSIKEHLLTVKQARARMKASA